MSLWGALAAFRFECKRSFTPARLGWWAALVLFPVGIVAMIQYYGGDLNDPAQSGLILFGLIPQVVCLMGLLLWATPAIQSELEGKTWIYLAVRPDGKSSVLLGKYATAVVWTGTAALVGLSVSILLAQPAGAFHMWRVLAGLVVLSCLAYGALFSLLGVVFPRRAMLAAVAYTLFVEFIASLMPAVVNRFTVSYRLQNILVEQLGLLEEIPLEQMPREWQTLVTSLVSTAPTWQHGLALLAYSAALLALAVLVLLRRELVTAQEG